MARGARPATLRRLGCRMRRCRWPGSRLARPAFGSSTSPPPPGCSSGTTAARTAESSCPRRSGSGCAFLDYDADGWQDILLVNGMDWPGHTSASDRRCALYRNNRNGTFTDVTRAAGLDVEMYGMGVAVGDFNNDGFPDVLVTCVGQNRLFRNTGKGTFVDVTEPAASADARRSARRRMWFDFDRDGLLDLFVCNYVKWSAEHDVFCSLDGKQKSYCTPEAYRGETCWLFRNRGNGTFEDVTATSGIFDTSSKSLGVALLDYDQRRLAGSLRRQRHAAEQALSQPAQRHVQGRRPSRPGVAFSEDGKARAGMGVDAADFDNSGTPGLAITNFDNEMIGLYRSARPGIYRGCRDAGGRRRAVAQHAGLRLRLRRSRSRRRARSGRRQRPHRRDRPQHPRQRRLRAAAAPVPEPGQRHVSGRGAAAGAGFAQPRVGRGLAFGDFDRDGDVDLLMTTNNGPAVLFRNDQTAGNRSLRFRLVGTKSNRDAIGASVRIYHGGSVAVAHGRRAARAISRSRSCR